MELKRKIKNPHMAYRECADIDGCIRQYANLDHKNYEDGKQAQRDFDQKQVDELVGEIFRWIDSNPVFMQSNTLGIKVPIATLSEYQALKQKYGAK